MEQRECKTHGLTDFIPKTKTSSYLICRRCRIDAVKKRRAKVKQMAIEYKGGKCSCCGYDRCSMALEFHHTDPSQKDFSLSQDGHTISWSKVKTELDKCVMLCANCHREEHFRL